MISHPQAVFSSIYWFIHLFEMRNFRGKCST